MKYCKKCKLAAKETDTVCAKCGTPVSSFGASKPAAAPASSPAPGPSKPANTGPSAHGPARPPTAGPPRPPTAMFTLGGEVQKLIDIKQKNIQRGRVLGLLSLLVALAILMILYQVYSRTVLAYAVIDNIKFEQDPIAENQLTISFDVKTPGKVAFDRHSGTGHTEKIDLIATTEGHKTVWAWPSDPKTGIDLSVLYRSGLFRTSQAKHFDVTRDGIGVEVVFLLDITSSMQNYIDALKRDCIEFAERVRKKKLDCQLGLIGFGDVNYNEPMFVFQPTSEVSKFQSNVDQLRANGGGDLDESSVEAIEEALKMKFRPHTRICFVHITDAPCHNRERIPGLVDALKERSIVTYVISQKSLRPLYRPLCVNGGEFYGIRDTPFDVIMKELAKSLVNTINSN